MRKLLLLILLPVAGLFMSGCASPQKEVKTGNWDTHADRMAQEDFQNRLNTNQGR